MILKTKNNKDIHHLIWVATARARDEVYRPILQCINVLEDKIVATDGHKLHLWMGKIHNLKPGLYSVARQSKARIELYLYDGSEFGISAYPDYESIMPKYNLPDNPSEWEVEEYTKVKNIVFGGNISRNYTEVIRSMGITVTIEFDLFKNAFPGMESVWVSDGKPFDCLTLLGRDRVGVVMPLRSFVEEGQ